MTPVLWTRKQLAFILTIVTFVCVVAFLSLSLARSEPFPNADLGTEWRCSKTLFVTSCTRTPHTPAAFHSAHKDALGLRQA